jgi:hypothetical protein
VATISVFLCYSDLQTDQNIGAAHFVWFGVFLSTIGRGPFPRSLVVLEANGSATSGFTSPDNRASEPASS